MRPTAYRQPVTRRDLECLLGRTIDLDAVSRPRTAGLGDAIVLDVPLPYRGAGLTGRRGPSAAPTGPAAIPPRLTGTLAEMANTSAHVTARIHAMTSHDDEAVPPTPHANCRKRGPGSAERATLCERISSRESFPPDRGGFNPLMD